MTMTAKKKKACIRNWAIFRLKGASTAVSELSKAMDLTPRQKAKQTEALNALAALQLSLKGNDK